MKIGVLTFHMAHNYGAMLQAYALRKYLSRLGAESEVIDYRLEYIYKWHMNLTRKQLISQNGIFLGHLKWMHRWICGYYSKNGRRYRFDNFMLKDMRISESVTNEQLDKGKLEYDLIFFGSDQIWNPNLTGGVCKEYFGDFPSNAVKVSYAASKGEFDFSNQQAIYQKLLNNLDMISVREASLVKELKEMGYNSVEEVLDPTFLVTKNQWEKLANSNYRVDIKNYILLYDIQDDSRMVDLARDLAYTYNKKIVYLAYKKKKGMKGVYQIVNAGPKEFLQLFKKADMIVTNSFHGTCFSIIFEKDFFVIEKKGGDSRIRSLLDKIGLTERIVLSKIETENIQAIKYDLVKIALQQKINESKDFINRAMALVEL